MLAYPGNTATAARSSPPSGSLEQRVEREAFFPPQMAQANYPHLQSTLHLCRLFQNVGKQMIVSGFVAVCGLFSLAG